MGLSGLMQFHSLTIKHSMVITMKLGLWNRSKTTLGNTCNRRVFHALAFCSMIIKGRKRGGNSQYYVYPLQEKESLHFLFQTTNCDFLLIFYHWNLRLKSQLLTLLSWLNSLVQSVLRKFVLPLQHVLGFMYLDSLSLSLSLLPHTPWFKLDVVELSLTCCLPFSKTLQELCLQKSQEISCFSIHGSKDGMVQLVP